MQSSDLRGVRFHAFCGAVAQVGVSFIVPNISRGCVFTTETDMFAVLGFGGCPAEWEYVTQALQSVDLQGVKFQAFCGAVAQVDVGSIVPITS